MPRWEERAALAHLVEGEIAKTHLVPTMFVRLLRLPDDGARALRRAPRSSCVLHGAAPVSPDVKRRMIDWWGPVLVEYWGASESGVITLVDSEEWLAHPETVGRALPAWEVFAVDEDGATLPPGETGTLYARHKRTPGLFEYHDAPEKTRESYLATGRLHDRRHRSCRGGRTRLPGRPRLPHDHLGRRQHLPGGDRARPARAPAGGRRRGLRRARRRVGRERQGGHRADGTRPRPRRPSRRRSSTFVRARIAGYKVPRSIDFEDALPRTSSGKLYVRRLRDPYWEGRTRRI